jgi:C-terminal processing protease CtpA/Prc
MPALVVVGIPTSRNRTHCSFRIRGSLPGTSITYQSEYHFDRFDQAASFWVKKKPPRLGIVFRDLTQEEKQRNQRNRGAVVFAIVKGSPAFLADVLRGDLVTALGNDDVIDQSSYTQLLDKYSDQDVELHFFRNGRQYSKLLHVNRVQ